MEPNWSGLSEDGTDEDAVGDELGLLVVAPACPRESFQYSHSAFCSGGYFGDIGREDEVVIQRYFKILGVRLKGVRDFSTSWSGFRRDWCVSEMKKEE